MNIKDKPLNIQIYKKIALVSNELKFKVNTYLKNKNKILKEVQKEFSVQEKRLEDIFYLYYIFCLLAPKYSMFHYSYNQSNNTIEFRLPIRLTVTNFHDFDLNTKLQIKDKKLNFYLDGKNIILDINNKNLDIDILNIIEDHTKNYIKKEIIEVLSVINKHLYHMTSIARTMLQSKKINLKITHSLNRDKLDYKLFEDGKFPFSFNIGNKLHIDMSDMKYEDVKLWINNTMIILIEENELKNVMLKSNSSKNKKRM